MLIFDLSKTQPMSNVKFHGGGKYGEVIFSELIKQKKDIVVYYNANLWINPNIESLIQSNNLVIADSNNISLIDCAKKYKASVYSPLIEGDLDKIKDVKYLTTIHGLRELEMPFDKYAYFYGNKKTTLWANTVLTYLRSQYRFKKVFKKYKLFFSREDVNIITVSNHSKYSILNFFPNFKESNIKVCYSPSVLYLEDYGRYSEEKYYLIVSGGRWIKNSYRAIKAFDELCSERRDFEGKLIITGVASDSINLKDIKNKDRIVFLNYVDDDVLASLYKGAYALIYPSLNEGFGYPPLQAMYYNVPILASAISSIIEITDNAALYFNPYLISEVKMRLLQLEDKSVRIQLVDLGKKRLNFIKKKQDNDLLEVVDYIIEFSNL